MNSSALLFILLGIFVLLAVVLAYEERAKQMRRKALGSFALRHGLTYDAKDRIGLLSVPFQLFAQGDDRGIDNILDGTWHGTGICAFDFWFSTTVSTGKSTSRHVENFTCVVVPVDAACPGLSIEREDIFTRLGDHIGFADIQFELDEFNRTFNVKGEDRMFATAFCDQAMMQWLLTNAGTCAFEAAGGKLLVYSDQVDVEGLPSLLDTARGFRERVPRVVFSLYSH